MGNLLDVIAVDCDSCNSAGFVFYGTEGSLVMPCECEGEYEVLGDFNLMFKTNVGPVETENSSAYLRPETAQLIFSVIA